jgi:hypothetical protein
MDDAVGFGAFLPQEAISNTLAETCQELRRVLQQRSVADETPSQVRSA